jgi:CheY-like chemotaxis protein
VDRVLVVDDERAIVRVLAVNLHNRGYQVSTALTGTDALVDLLTRTVRRADAHVHLTPTEWQMLEVLVRRPGALTTASEWLAQGGHLIGLRAPLELGRPLGRRVRLRAVLLVEIQVDGERDCQAASRDDYADPMRVHRCD